MIVYTPQEAAGVLSMTKDRVTELCRSGEIPASNVGKGESRKRWRITEDDLITFLESRKTRSGQSTTRKQLPPVKDFFGGEGD